MRERGRAQPCGSVDHDEAITRAACQGWGASGADFRRKCGGCAVQPTWPHALFRLSHLSDGPPDAAEEAEQPSAETFWARVPRAPFLIS